MPRKGKQADRVPAPGGQPLLVGLVYVKPTLTLFQALKQVITRKGLIGCRISTRGTWVKSAGLNAQKRWNERIFRQRPLALTLANGTGLYEVWNVNLGYKFIPKRSRSASGPKHSLWECRLPKVKFLTRVLIPFITKYWRNSCFKSHGLLPWPAFFTPPSYEYLPLSAIFARASVKERW